MGAVRYAVRVYGSGTNFGLGDMICELHDVHAVGWADYMNDVPEAFFTLYNDHPLIAGLAAGLVADGESSIRHVRVYRQAQGALPQLVWGGVLGEWSTTYQDTVFYCYGYLAWLYQLLTDWNTEWTSEQINTIVSALWARAKTDLTYSPVAWVTTGTIEAPVTTSGGATPIVLPTYNVYYKRILTALQEMAVLGAGDTNNIVRLEITPAGTFNFWKNDGSDLSTIWRLGDKKVLDFELSTYPILHRTFMRGVGVNPNNVSLRYDTEAGGTVAAVGRREEPIYLAWVRDSTSLAQALGRRLARALRDQNDLTLAFYANKIIPPGATGEDFSLGDRVNVNINRGMAQIDGLRMVIGYQVVWSNAQERVRAILQQRPG